MFFVMDLCYNCEADGKDTRFTHLQDSNILQLQLGPSENSSRLTLDTPIYIPSYIYLSVGHGYELAAHAKDFTL